MLLETKLVTSTTSKVKTSCEGDRMLEGLVERAMMGHSEMGALLLTGTLISCATLCARPIIFLKFHSVISIVMMVLDPLFSSNNL